MAVLKRIGWALGLVVIGIPIAIVTTLIAAVGVLVGTHEPSRTPDGFGWHVEKVRR